MIAKGGSRLINKSAIINLKKNMIKKTYLITPNIPEAEVLTNMKIKNINDMISAAKAILKLGAKNVLLKGGHSNYDYVSDVFVNNKELKDFQKQKN